MFFALGSGLYLFGALGFGLYLFGIFVGLWCSVFLPPSRAAEVASLVVVLMMIGGAALCVVASWLL